MKRFLTVIFILLLILSLTACGQEKVESVYTVALGNDHYTVDTQNLTISDGTYTYSYEINGGKTTITYPNGAIYYWSWQGNVGHGGRSEDYDDSVYTDGETLLKVLEQDRPGTRKERERSGNPLLGLLFIGLGLWNAISPYSSWYLSHGWKYRDAEPSDEALGMTRFGGIAGIVIGVILLFV